MSTLNSSLTTVFKFDDFTAPNNLDGTLQGSVGQQDTIINALNLVYANSNFKNQYGHLSSYTPVNSLGDSTIHFRMIPLVQGSENGFYAQDGTVLPLPGQTAPIHENMINFTSGILQNGIDEAAINGGSFHQSFAGVLIHELSHALLTPYAINYTYREEAAIFLENYWSYRVLNSTTERMGHNGPVSGGDIASPSAISYVKNMALEFIHGPINSGDVTTFLFSNKFGDSLLKTYYGINYHGLDHLVTVAAYSPTAVFNSAFGIGNANDKLITGNSLVQNLVDKGAYLGATKAALDAMETSVGAMQTAGTHFGWLDAFKAATPTFNANTLLTISGERFADGNYGLDVEGPISTGGSTSQAAPTSIFLQADNVGDVVFGASGYRSTESGSATMVNLTRALDVVVGGAGNDILFAGNGTPVNGGSSILQGGGGADVLVGASTIGPNSIGTPSATLIAAAGAPATVFISGPGHDSLIGGPQLTDIASYAGSKIGVTIDLSQSSDITYQDAAGQSHTVSASMGFVGDATGDRYANIDVFVGSTHSDTFTGSDSMFHTFIGNGGGDTFNLHNGDVAVGGSGADTFNIVTDGGSDAVFIYGVEDGDKIQINGTTYTGRTETMQLVVLRTANDGHPIYGYQVVSDTGSQTNDWFYRGHIGDESGPYSGFGHISMDTSGGGHLNIYMAGMQSGNPAGLHYALDWPAYFDDYGVIGFATSNMDESPTYNPGSWWQGAYISSWEGGNKGIVGF